MSPAEMRNIVKIDEDKCDGCGLCVPSCAEGAIEIVDGKARLVGENLCDGLGACLGECPRDAIIIEERPAEAFDEQSVERHLAERTGSPKLRPPPTCPGTMLRDLRANCKPPAETDGKADRPSQLGQWPVQLALVPAESSIWQDADVLIVTDCVPFAMADFHDRLLAGKTVAVVCPKLDDLAPHIEKLTRIFENHDIRSITVGHMEVPCCIGIVHAVTKALEAAGKTNIPVSDVTVKIDGSIARQLDQRIDQMVKGETK